MIQYINDIYRVKVYTKLHVFLKSVLAMLINLFKNCQNLDQLIKVCLFSRKKRWNGFISYA